MNIYLDFRQKMNHFHHACRTNWDRMLSRTRLDRLTSSERLLLIGLLTALVWGSVGITFKAQRLKDNPSDSSSLLYQKLLAALPDRDYLLSAEIESSATSSLRPAARRMREDAATEIAHEVSEPLETVPARIYLTQPPTAEEEPLNIRRIKAGLSGPGRRSEGKININTASLEDLMRLPGIGPAFASRIIQHRERHGGFASLMDLKKIRGIGEKRFERIKDRVKLY